MLIPYTIQKMPDGDVQLLYGQSFRVSLKNLKEKLSSWSSCGELQTPLSKDYSNKALNELTNNFIELTRQIVNNLEKTIRLIEEEKHLARADIQSQLAEALILKSHEIYFKIGLKFLGEFKFKPAEFTRKMQDSLTRFENNVLNKRMNGIGELIKTTKEMLDILQSSHPDIKRLNDLKEYAETLKTSISSLYKLELEAVPDQFVYTIAPERINAILALIAQSHKLMFFQQYRRTSDTNADITAKIVGTERETILRLLNLL